MMVQDCSAPKPTATPHCPTNNIKISDNLSKITAASLLILTTAAAILLLPNLGNTAALLCFERSRSTPSPSSLPPLPSINFNYVPLLPLTPSSPFSSAPTAGSLSLPPSLRSLSRIKGWQLLVVGTSRTSYDRSLKGAIYLSLEAQAQLGFRITGHSDL